MIYFTNTSAEIPHMTFIGRWTPFHKGHAAMILKKIRENPAVPVLICVRNSPQDAFKPLVRAEYIKSWMTAHKVTGTIMIIPNVEGVYWGRGVGYHTGQVDLDPSVTNVSATKIRALMATSNDAWKHMVANRNASHLLTPKISGIVERGQVVWLTGCPSSGKTTTARAFIDYARTHYPHLKYQLLDGDDMRKSPLAEHVGYEKSDRMAHLTRMGYLASLFADHGILVVCAFVSPYESARKAVQKLVGKDRFVEVYIRTSKKLRMKRDPKGLYKKAALGKLPHLTGYNDPYEIPSSPDVVCDTARLSPRACAEKIAQCVF